ncbi:MAG: C39 family peptidase [Patescibacteria group bacterium]|nr:C39 family peptidase [Patescibacteria group bacterium]
MEEKKPQFIKKRHIKRLWRKSRLLVIAAVFIIVLTGGIYKGYPKYRDYVDSKNRKDSAYEVQEIVRPETKPTETPVKIKESALIEVPYTVQAPYANWNIHEESCEEAASLMYYYFLNGQTTFNGSTIIPLATADAEFIKMKNWQVARYGKEPDLSTEAWGKFMTDYYGFKYKNFKNITAEDIKREISAGHPVVVPVITHGLQNPHYGRQPSYHLLLIKGYKPEGVITNDAGVKEGENYFYTWDILFKAIDAQTPQMKQGREMTIVTK